MACEKFCILSGAIAGSLNRASAILIACACLHNFIIRQVKPFGNIFEHLPDEIDELDGIATHPNAPLGMTYLPVVPNDDFQKYYGIS